MPLLIAFAFALAVAAWVAAEPGAGQQGSPGDGQVSSVHELDHGTVGVRVGPAARPALQAPQPSSGLAPTRSVRSVELRTARQAVDPHPRAASLARPTFAPRAYGAPSGRASTPPPHRLLAGLSCFSLGTPPPQS